MSTALILKLTIATFATLLIAAIAWWARKHPNRSKEYPEQVRMPKAVPFVGLAFPEPVGLLMGLFAFAFGPRPSWSPYRFGGDRPGRDGIPDDVPQLLCGAAGL